ncbi:hypothetical protein VTL71DRAFT_7594 [Oculimacula yallundae]|uniref:RanBP2-type domain-containing protein n=1 Tax=Oculimacula yallundae TaxID=86028 RepID=A0ABR4BW36_9HELO
MGKRRADRPAPYVPILDPILEAPRSESPALSFPFGALDESQVLLQSSVEKYESLIQSSIDNDDSEPSSLPRSVVDYELKTNSEPEASRFSSDSDDSDDSTTSFVPNFKRRSQLSPKATLAHSEAQRPESESAEPPGGLLRIKSVSETSESTPLPTRRRSLRRSLLLKRTPNTEPSSPPRMYTNKPEIFRSSSTTPSTPLVKLTVATRGKNDGVWICCFCHQWTSSSWPKCGLCRSTGKKVPEFWPCKHIKCGMCEDMTDYNRKEYEEGGPNAGMALLEVLERREEALGELDMDKYDGTPGARRLCSTIMTRKHFCSILHDLMS